jgi:hypothetical protein
MMKEYLFTRYSRQSTDTKIQFRQNLVKGAPYFNRLVTDSEREFWSDRHFPMWGHREDGFWTVTEDEGRFYDNNGDIYIISPTITDNCLTIYKELTEKLTTVETATLEEHEVMFLNNTNHTALPLLSTPVYYGKFVPPNNKFGVSVFVNFASKNTTVTTELITNIVNANTKVFEALKELGHPFPSRLPAHRNYYLDDECMYFGPPTHPFNMAIEDAIPKYLEELEFVLTEFSAINQSNYGISLSVDSASILEQARTQWTALLT